MEDFNILIVDDDPRWLDRHRKGLKRKEFTLYLTTDAGQAVEIARTKNITFGVIDEILEVPPISQDGSGELQHLQGRGIIREIREYGLRPYFAFITAAPIIFGQGSEQARTQMVKSLRTSSPGVISVINKAEIESVDSRPVYEALINLIKIFSFRGELGLPNHASKNERFYLHQQRIIVFENPSIAVMNIDTPSLTQSTKKSSTNQPDSGDDAMNSNSSISFDGANIGAANINNTVNGNQISTQHNYAEHSDHHEMALELRQLLLQIEQPCGSEVNDSIIVEEIKTQMQVRPQLKAKIFAAIESGGAEALKQLCQHPAAEIAIAAFEGWRSTEEE